MQQYVNEESRSTLAVIHHKTNLHSKWNVGDKKRKKRKTYFVVQFRWKFYNITTCTS